MPAILIRDESSTLQHSARDLTPRSALEHAPTSLEHTHAHILEARDSPNQIAIPAVYTGLNTGPSAGTVVGITLGSVAGFILLIWLFSALSGNMRGSVVDEEEVVVRRSRSPRSKRSRRSEMASRSPRPPERIVRQERIVRDMSRGPPRSSYVVAEETRPERRVDGDDIVEVIEEQSSVAPRRKSKRSSSRNYR